MEEHREHIMRSGGFCVCPKCGHREPHLRGRPCQEEHCHECGAKLLREGSPHHELFLRKQSEGD
jgi:hypothetical protein